MIQLFDHCAFATSLVAKRLIFVFSYTGAGSGRIRTLNVRVMIQLFDHCAIATSLVAKRLLFFAIFLYSSRQWQDSNTKSKGYYSII